MTNKSQTKFAAGDKVVRASRPDMVCDGGIVVVGGIYEVKSVRQNGVVIEVVGSDYTYNAEYFKLVKENPTFKAMKFKVTSPEQSKEIQEALFSMGYGWELYGKQLKSFKDFHGNPWLEKWLHTDEDGILYRSDEDPDCDVTPSSPFYHQEYTIKTTKSYELDAVVTEAIEETVELMGQKYSKKELEDALRSLKPVE